MPDDPNKLTPGVSGVFSGQLSGLMAQVRGAVDEVRLDIAGAAAELVTEIQTGKQVARALRSEAANVRAEFASVLGNAPPADEPHGEKG